MIFQGCVLQDTGTADKVWDSSQNLQICRVPVWKSRRTYKPFWVQYGSCTGTLTRNRVFLKGYTHTPYLGGSCKFWTDLTELLGAGMRGVQSPQNNRVPLWEAYRTHRSVQYGTYPGTTLGVKKTVPYITQPWIFLSGSASDNMPIFLYPQTLASNVFAVIHSHQYPWAKNKVTFNRLFSSRTFGTIIVNIRWREKLERRGIIQGKKKSKRCEAWVRTLAFWPLFTVDHFLHPKKSS